MELVDLCSNDTAACELAVYGVAWKCVHMRRQNDVQELATSASGAGFAHQGPCLTRLQVSTSLQGDATGDMTDTLGCRFEPLSIECYRQTVAKAIAISSRHQQHVCDTYRERLVGEVEKGCVGYPRAVPRHLRSSMPTINSKLDERQSAFCNHKESHSIGCPVVHELEVPVSSACLTCDWAKEASRSAALRPAQHLGIRSRGSDV